MSIVLNGSTGIQNVLGSASSPADTNTTTPTTGVYYPSATTWGVSTAGTNALYIDASQNVGIGTTSPLGKLSISALNPSLVLNATTAGKQTQWLNYDNGSLIWFSGINYNNSGDGNYYFQRNSGTGNFIIAPDGNGNVGIGTTSPTNKLTVNGSISITGTAATSIAALAVSGSTTANAYGYFLNTGGGFYYGIENSVGGSIATGAAAYSTVLTTSTSTPLHLATNSTVRATIDSSGNVGIGVTPNTGWGSSAKVLQMGSYSAFYQNNIGYPEVSFNSYESSNAVYKYQISSNPASLYSQRSAQHVWYIAPSGTAGNTISFTQAMTLDTSGNLLLGTTTVLNGGVFSESFNGQTVNGVVLRTTWSSTGSYYIQFQNSSGASAGIISQNGTTTVNYGTSSDYRLKENVQPMVGALETVSKLKPVTFTWKVDNSAGQGFIAHELQEVMPDCVTGQKDDVYPDGSIKPQNVDASFLVATLTAAIQELKAEFDAYKTSHP